MKKTKKKRFQSKIMKISECAKPHENQLFPVVRYIGQCALLSSPLNFTKLGTHQPAGKKTKSNSAGYGFWYNVELPISTPNLVFITQPDPLLT